MNYLHHQQHQSHNGSYQHTPQQQQQMTPQYLQAYSDQAPSPFQTQFHQNSQQISNSQANQSQTLDEQRRQDILQKLQQERELRRRFVQEGKANEFQLDTLNSARVQQNDYNQQNHIANSHQVSQSNMINGGLPHSQHAQSHQQLQIMNQQQQFQRYSQQPNYQVNSDSQSFDNRQGPQSNTVNQLNYLNENESLYSGYSNNIPQNHGFAQNQNSNGNPSKSDIVNKLLNERRASKSQSFVNNQSNNTSYSQHNHQQQQQQQQQTYLNQPSHNQSDISPDINEAFGGYNPEALYQEDVVSNHQFDEGGNNDEDYNKQYLQQDFQAIEPTQQFKYNNVPIHNQAYGMGMAFNQTSQSSLNQQAIPSNQSLDDQKYQDAVQYAKMQIQQELRKKQQINQQYNNHDFVDSYPSERMQGVIQNSKQGGRQNNHDSAPEPERRGPPKPSADSFNHNSTQNYLDYNNTQGGLPPSVKQMDKNIANQSLSKTHQEMNKKIANRSNKQATQQHHFNYESEDDQKYRMTGLRPQSATHRQTSNQNRNLSSRPPEYMKNTVNADLKRGPQATVSKTKQLITEAEKKFNEECTFKPQINDYQVKVSKEFSKEERWKKLTEPKTSEIQKREIIKAKIEQEEAFRSCPFKPQITQSAKKSKPDKENDDLPLPQRLMHEADIRKEKREKLKREHEQQLMKDCSFKPQLMTTSSSVVNINKFSNQLPIHERVNHLQKEKNEKLQKLRMKSEQDQQDLTFHPQVNQKSAKITTVKRMEEESRPKDVVERLYQDAANRIDKQMNHTESYHDQLNRDCSFQPHISKTSNYLSEKSDQFNGNLKDFYDRQQAFLTKQQEKRQDNQQKYSQEAQCSFKPEINVTSDIIMESDPKRGAETEDDRYYRLYKKDSKKQEIVKEMIEKEVYQQYTFKPQINKISKTLAKGSSIDELAYNPKGQQKREMLQEQQETQEINYCTFRPETTKTKKYQKVESTYKFNDCESLEQFSMNLKQKLKEKQEKIAKVRKEREYEQQKDCTFKPSILDKDPATQKDQVVVVRGLGRHLELKELQKKKEEDKKLREAEVFGLNHKFAINSEELDITNPNRPQSASVNVTRLNQTQNGAYTVPKPFELSQTKQERKSLLLKELNEKERQQCTFKPNTNEGRNRKLIKEILEEAEDKENDVEYTQDQLNYMQNNFSSNF
eukprot:403364769